MWGEWAFGALSSRPVTAKVGSASGQASSSTKLWADCSTEPIQECKLSTVFMKRAKRAMHVRAARRNGLSVDEIKEVLLQTAIYCGVPDANTAFRVAPAVLEDEEPPHQEDDR